jgi:hypothetical protein
MIRQLSGGYKMADLAKVAREYNALLAVLPADQRDSVLQLSQNPDVKVIIRTPGTEPKLNGVTAADISALVRDFEPGQAVTKRVIIEGLGGNPKSSSDAGKVAKAIPSVPELEIRPGRKGEILRRLTNQATS